MTKDPRRGKHLMGKGTLVRKQFVKKAVGRPKKEVAAGKKRAYKKRVAKAMPVEKAAKKQPTLLVVKAAQNAVTNKEEFVNQMAALNYRIVFLDYKNFMPTPIIDRFPGMKTDG